MAKKGQKQKKYSAEFKIGVIIDMREHRLSYLETARKYGLLGRSKGGALCTLQRWERIYLEEAAKGLMKGRLGRACKENRTHKGGLLNLDKQVEEDLVAENQRLRMEIEYLKN